MTDALPVRYIDDTVLITTKGAWTWVRIPQVAYEFRTDGERESAAARIAAALVSLAPRNDSIEAHLIVTTSPFNASDWASDLAGRTANWTPKPGWLTYLGNMATYVAGNSYTTKSVYLGIKLPRATNTSKMSLDSVLGPTAKWLKRPELILGINDPTVPQETITQAHKTANTIRRVLADSHIRAVPATADEVAWLIAKPFWPTRPVHAAPDIARNSYSGGELHSLVDSTLNPHRRYLRIEQPVPGEIGETIGYQAWACATRFPDILHFPDQEPWIHHAATLPFPVDIHARFLVTPAAQVAKDVKKKLADAMDQASHIAEGGMHVPQEILDQLQTASDVGYGLKKDTTPWVYAWYRFGYTAESVEEITARGRALADHYRDLGIDMVTPSGDQYQLLKESIPGYPLAANAPYGQKQSVITLAIGMPHATAAVGDNPESGEGWLGPFIGETTSRVRLPVFLSPHNAMARNHPPTAAIIGAPGGGKSLCAFTLAYQCATQGTWTIYIDPKADAKPMGSLPGLGKAQVLDLRHGNDGMLDPFAMADTPAEQSLLALETLRLLLGGVRISEERESALIWAVNAVAAQPQPSLAKVVQLLGASADIAAQNLGSTLGTLQQLPFARLCFAPESGTRLRPEEGLTIVTLLGLDLPTAGSSPDNYSYENRLAVAVLYLLTRYARKLMLSLDKSHPKAIFIDEAWAITGTDQGARLIPEIARMGRSHNTALVLVTQNAQDLMDEQITNSVSTVLAFRSTNQNEIDAVLTLLGVEVSNTNRAAIRDLYTGECLMRDIDRRVSRVQVIAWEPTLFTAFDTNPETRGKSESGSPQVTTPSVPTPTPKPSTSYGKGPGLLPLSAPNGSRSLPTAPRQVTSR